MASTFPATDERNFTPSSIPIIPPPVLSFRVGPVGAWLPKMLTESKTGGGGGGGGVLLLVSFLHDMPRRNTHNSVNTAFFLVVFRKPTIFSILFLFRFLLFCSAEMSPVFFLSLSFKNSLVIIPLTSDNIKDYTF